MKKKTIIIVIVCALLAYMLPFGILFTGVLVSDHYELSDIKTTKNGYIIEDEVEVTKLDSYYNEEKKIYVVTGYAKNNSKTDMSSGEVVFQFYDKDGVIIGESSSYVSNLSKGKTWKFKVEYSEDDAIDAASYELIRAYFYKD